MRLIGIFLGVIALGALFADAAIGVDSGFPLRSFGELWFTYHPDSWLLLQPAVERHVNEDLWFNLFEPVFRQPAAVTAALLSLGFFALSLILRRPSD